MCCVCPQQQSYQDSSGTHDIVLTGIWYGVNKSTLEIFFLAKKKEDEGKSMLCNFPWNEIAGVYFVEIFRDSY